MKSLTALLILAISSCFPTNAEEISQNDFIATLDPATSTQAFALLDEKWDDGYTGPLLELLQYDNNPDFRNKTIDLIRKKSGLGKKASRDEAKQWLWKREVRLPSWYASFKSRLYSNIDKRFAEYFDDNPKATIRLDEIAWGGVLQDGIPPLDHPKVIEASDASYLADSDIVFGVSINGVQRAYPKRILAWHEMVRDKIAGHEYNGVYCTLCGTMILYDPVVKGTHHVLGTSGFLYRSNKLMYDKATKSMWSTTEGVPVVGPLVGKGIELDVLPVVTTTWGEWRKLHPKTKVLSLDTGYKRDYGEGVAYKDYFSTDELMFKVPGTDTRLKNKDEVLALRFGSAKAQPTVISQRFLLRNRIFQSTHDSTPYTVITDDSGANRIYSTGDMEFTSIKANTVTDSKGETWTVTETALTSPDGKKLKRLPAHRAFWFGWHAAHPDTRLISENSG